MIIDKKTVQDIAHLARLEVSEEKESQLIQEMNNILEWMTKLNEVDTENVEPLLHMSSELNVLRNDEQGDTLSHEQGLVNAPKKDSNYFRVPKVIE